AMDEAISELSLKCDPTDASRALYLLSAPAREMNMDLIKDLGDYLADVASEALIRNGDYPREKSVLDVTVMLSELSDVVKVREYYEKSTSYIPEVKKKQKKLENKLDLIDEAGKDIPSLL
ncbi:MAG: cell division protein FtsZ, partial [Dehalococcoidales bacterium]|nr:cell division protein FtsZ [Dehalococcoidales bacterium]